MQQQVKPGSSISTATYTWNREGAILTTVDGAQNSTLRTYDTVGRIQSFTSGLGKATYSYVAGTVLPSVVVNPSATIGITYDLAGRATKTTITDASGRTVAGNRSFQYSPLGDLSTATVVVPGGQTETSQFTGDSLHRRISESDSLSPVTISHVYGARDETITLNSVSTSSSIDRQVDALGRPLLLSLNGQPIAQWQYGSGAPSTISYTGGNVLSYQYDSNGRITSENVSQGATGLVSISRSFGSDYLPHEYTLKVNSIPVETDYFMTDDSGRVVAEQSNRPGTSSTPSVFGNSDVTPLLGAAGSQYVLDGAANWQSRSGPEPLTTTIDSANRYATINGQTVQNINGGGIQTFGAQQYQWNGLNQMSSATVGGNSRSWQRDALGRQTQETDALGNANRLIWDGDTLIAMMPKGQSGALTIHAGFNGQDTLAIANPSVGTSLLYHGPDQSVFAVSDTNGAVLQAYSYTAFGAPHSWNASGAATDSVPVSPYLFQGARYDAPLGLYLMGARMYIPSVGRFLSPDPIGQAGGLNLFAFVGGRPLSSTDPDGTTERPDKFVAATIGFDVAIGVAWRMLGMPTASEFLYHSLFGHGEPLRPSKDWIQGVGGWGEDYDSILEGKIQDAFREASRAYLSGQLKGLGTFQGRRKRPIMSS